MYTTIGDNEKHVVTIRQGVPRGLAGPLAGCEVSSPPEAAQEIGDLNSSVTSTI